MNKVYEWHMTGISKDISSYDVENENFGTSEQREH